MGIFQLKSSLQILCFCLLPEDTKQDRFLGFVLQISQFFKEKKHHQVGINKRATCAI